MGRDQELILEEMRMGMFDYVICNYPLPDGEDGSGREFQTKDTDSQYLDRYEIRADGTLWFQRHPQGGMVQQYFTGPINFYSSNVTASGPNGCVTDAALTPATFWDYTALFQDGKVVKITGGKSVDTERPVISWDEFSKS